MMVHRALKSTKHILNAELHTNGLSQYMLANECKFVAVIIDVFTRPVSFVCMQRFKYHCIAMTLDILDHDVYNTSIFKWEGA